LSPLPQQPRQIAAESFQAAEVTSKEIQEEVVLDVTDPLEASSMGIICPGARVWIRSLSTTGLSSLNDTRALVLHNIPGSGKWLVELEGNVEVQLALLSENLEPEKPLTPQDLTPTFTNIVLEPFV
jgi:hypothetical protein